MTLRRRYLGLLGAVAIVASACGSSTTSTPPSTAPTTAPTPAASTAPESMAPSESAAASPSSATVDVNAALFGSTYKPGPGQSGGTIVMGEWQPVDNLNPYFTTAYTSFEALGPALRGLVTIDSQGKYLPDLAASIPTPDNGKVVVTGDTFTVEVTLKPGLKWSDGQPLTMNDFKYTWQWATDPGQKGCAGCTVGWPEVASIDVSADGLTGTIHFKELYAGWLAFLTTAILPEHYFSKLKIADASKSMPVTSAVKNIPWSGPFMITNASSTEIDYDRNPNWAAGVGGAHAPYLDHLKFQYFGTKDGMIAAFKNGEIDLALDLTQADYATIQGVDPSVGTAELQPAWQYEHFDLNNDPNNTRGWDMNNLDVRTAIAMAVNKPDLISAVFPGANLTPACSVAPPGLWYRVDETCPAFDVQGAKDLLTKAGWVAGSDGYVAKNGKTMDLEMCTTAGNPTRLTELQKMQSYLQAIGVKSHIVTADAGSVVFAGWADTKPDTDCSIYRGNYDIADFAYIIGADIYNNYFYTYASSQWPELGDNSGSNDTRFSSPAMDQALAAVKSAVNLQDQLQYAKAIEDAYNAGVPEIPLYYRAETTGIGAKLGNWPTYNPSSIGPTWDVEDWFVKQ
jgi:peptide/nickel transport system substrate-binding protein